MIDQFSVSLVTALVVLVGGSLFILDTLFRRHEQTGRIWALGYLSAMTTTLLYLVWAWRPETVWSVVAGNATFVLGTGAMWLGCARFNGRPVRGRALIVVAAGAAAALAAALEWYPGPGDWAGALVMFIGIGTFAALASVECFRGELGTSRSALPLGVVFGVQFVFYLGRIVIMVTQGVESQTFTVWFGTFATSLVTVVLTITAVVATSVLRATRAGLRGATAVPGEAAGRGEILAMTAFTAALAHAADKARRRGDLLAVTVVQRDGMPDIAAAFGLDMADEQTRAWRGALTDESPTVALLGELGPDALAVVSVASSPAAARSDAMRLYRAMFEALGTADRGALPAVGIGVALSDIVGYEPGELLELGRRTAERASSGVASAVLLAEPQ